MSTSNVSLAPPLQDVQGKHNATTTCCWFLGLSSLLAWNSMLTLLDYYNQNFPEYHPSRVLTLMYQPCALSIVIYLAWNESKTNTRTRNMARYCLFLLLHAPHKMLEDQVEEWRKGLVAVPVCLARVLFFPTFYFTAKYGDQGWMLMLVSLLGLTNGHLTIYVMMDYPNGYKGPEQNTLGTLSWCFLLVGYYLGLFSIGFESSTMEASEANEEEFICIGDV